MTRKQIGDILEGHGFSKEDVDEFLNAAQDVLYVEAERLKKEEPHATVTIERIEAAAEEISNVLDE